MSNKFKIENLPAADLSASNSDLAIFERNGVTHKIGVIDFTQPKFAKYDDNSTTLLDVMPNSISYVSLSNDVEISSIQFNNSTSSSCSRSYVVVVDRRSQSNETDWTMPFPNSFYPASSKNADYICLAGKINIFYVTEIMPGIFIVNGQSISEQE